MSIYDSSEEFKEVYGFDDADVKDMIKSGIEHGLLHNGATEDDLIDLNDDDLDFLVIEIQERM